MKENKFTLMRNRQYKGILIKINDILEDIPLEQLKGLYEFIRWSK